VPLGDLNLSGLLTMSDFILGIESSCDDTAVAIVDASGHVLSSVIASQEHVHKKYGGVFPELASREHMISIIPAVEEALLQACITPKELRAIGVTRGPGLIGSLLVGLHAASGLGLGWGLPVIGVNHLRGHLRSADLECKRVKYPAIVLLVSGGHTFLAYMQDEQNISCLGSTRDDSVGEVYDKVARMLGLGYPGGALVDKLALKGSVSINFPRPMLNDGLAFSFSGLKSSVSRYCLNTGSIIAEDVAASFVEAVIETLITKCRRALVLYHPVSLVIVGGVSASPQLRDHAKKLCDELNIILCLPPMKWSTDNGAMIALATWDYLKLEKYLEPFPQTVLPISEY
jgi:N6-L-threonylcarbamoyladenine synthase